MSLKRQHSRDRGQRPATGAWRDSSAPTPRAGPASPGSARPAGVSSACGGQGWGCRPAPRAVSIRRRPLGLPPLLTPPAGSPKPPRCRLHCAVSIRLLSVFSADPLLKPEEKQQSISVNAEGLLGSWSGCTPHCELRAGKPCSNARPATEWASYVLYLRCSVCRFTDGNIFTGGV